MIKRIDENTVEVAVIKVDNKLRSKRIIENVLAHSIAPLGFSLTPLIQHLNWLKKSHHNDFMSIDLFVKEVSSKINLNKQEFWLNTASVDDQLTISLVCSDKLYYNSIYSDREFMINTKGFEKMIIDIKTNEVNEEDYYWFNNSLYQNIKMLEASN